MPPASRSVTHQRVASTGLAPATGSGSTDPVLSPLAAGHELAAAAAAVASRERRARMRSLDPADRVLLLLRQRVREVAGKGDMAIRRAHMDTLAAFRRCDGDADGLLVRATCPTV